jgi:hypothetical protein
VIWREDDLYHARLNDSAERSQVCLAVDLFEVIAELAGLDLERGDQAAEAMSLAEEAQKRLRPAESHRPLGGGNGAPSARSDTAG